MCVVQVELLSNTERPVCQGYFHRKMRQGRCLFVHLAALVDQNVYYDISIVQIVEPSLSHATLTSTAMQYSWMQLLK